MRIVVRNGADGLVLERRAHGGLNGPEAVRLRNVVLVAHNNGVVLVDTSSRLRSDTARACGTRQAQPATRTGLPSVGRAVPLGLDELDVGGATGLDVVLHLVDLLQRDFAEFGEASHLDERHLVAVDLVEVHLKTLCAPHVPLLGVVGGVATAVAAAELDVPILLGVDRNESVRVWVVVLELGSSRRSLDSRGRGTGDRLRFGLDGLRTNCGSSRSNLRRLFDVTAGARSRGVAGDTLGLREWRDTVALGEGGLLTALAGDRRQRCLLLLVLQRLWFSHLYTKILALLQAS